MMMENIGLNSDIQAGGKIFHVQTQYSEPTEKIVSNMFENGKVISSKAIEVDGNISSQDLKVKVNKLHKDMSSELELLFYISEKVRTIQHAASNNKLGVVFLKKNLFDEAISEFIRALEIDPDFVEVYNNLGCAYLKKKRIAEARDMFLQGIKRNEHYADLHNNLGHTYFLLGNLNEAIQELNRANEINTGYINALYNLCLVYLKAVVENSQDIAQFSKEEMLNKVKELLITIKEQNQNIKYQHLDSALDLIEKNNYKDALKSLEITEPETLTTLALDLENDFYLNFMFGGKGKDDEFICSYTDQLKKAVDKFPQYADLRNNLGIAYLIQCRNLFLNALEQFRHALKINPQYKKAKKSLKLAENDGKGFLILLRAILK